MKYVFNGTSIINKFSNGYVFQFKSSDVLILVFLQNSSHELRHDFFHIFQVSRLAFSLLKQKMHFKTKYLLNGYLDQKIALATSTTSSSYSFLLLLLLNLKKMFLMIFLTMGQENKIPHYIITLSTW